MSTDSRENQVIEFEGTEENPRVEVYSRKVEISSAPCLGENVSASSWVKANRIVDYVWEERFYTGQLLAVHRQGQYLAYGIKGKSKSQCHIRVMNTTSYKRALMKDSEGTVEDLALAHLPLTSNDNNVATLMLAAVDSLGVLFVYHIIENKDDIKCNLILHVLQDESPSKVTPYKVFWCPYIPSDNPAFEEDDVSELLAVTRNTMVELWHMTIVADKNGKRVVKRGDVKDGYVAIEAHTDLITEAVFSPDGTAISTASMDGSCKFYQVYMVSDEDGSRCLHKWKPHNGAPVTLLYFLDDHKTYSPDIQFWKYAVTGTNYNTELKIWSCETWNCLQSIVFTSPLSGDLNKLKVGIDLSSNFIIANSLTNKLMYVLELERGEDSDVPHVSAVTELRLAYGILSFGIVSAERIFGTDNLGNRLTSKSSSSDEEEHTVCIKMYIVQPKSLQTCDIVYPVPLRKHPRLSISEELDLLSESSQHQLSNGMSNDSEGLLGDENDTSSNGNTIPSPPTTSAINLMTPAAFSSTPCESQSPHLTSSSTAVESADKDVLNSIDLEDIPPPFAAGSSEASAAIAAAAPKVNQPISPPLPPSQANIGVTTASGGSSPSREVQQIMMVQESSLNPDAVSSPLEAAPPPGSPEGLKMSYFENEISSIKSDLASIIMYMKQQSNEMQALQRELKLMQQHINESGKASVTAIEKRRDYGTDKIANSVKAAITSVIQSSVETAISQKMPALQSNTSSVITGALRDMKGGLADSMSKQLVASEARQREIITKLIHSPAVIKQIAASFMDNGKPAIESMIKECLADIVPKVDKTCQNLFEQLSTSFTDGTAEYLAQVEDQIERHMNENAKDVNELKDAAETFNASTKQFSQTVDIRLAEIETTLNESVSKAVARAVSSFLASSNASIANAGGVRSRAVTPAVLDQQALRDHLLGLVRQGHINTAFQEALSAGDLSLVTMLCERVPVSTVFTSNGCLLQQPILLSLVQQLSTDMASHSDNRHMYLEEAVMSLNSNNAVTREHMPAILSTLIKQLQSYLSTHPGSSLATRVRLLLIAAQNLVTN